METVNNEEGENVMELPQQTCSLSSLKEIMVADIRQLGKRPNERVLLIASVRATSVFRAISFNFLTEIPSVLDSLLVLCHSLLWQFHHEGFVLKERCFRY